MRFKVIASLLMIGLHYSVMSQEQNQVDYTLQESIDYALENNTSIINSAYEKEIAETQVGETLSQGLPQANVEAGINYNFEPQKSLIDISTFDPSVPEGTEQEVSFQQRYDGNINLNVRQLIFDGSFFVGLQASKTFKELSSKEHIKTKIDVVEAVSKAYYNVLVTEERFDLLQANLSRLDTLLEETSLMFENGFAEKIDVSRLKVQYNNLKVQYDNTEELLKVSKDLLKFQMGMPIGQPIMLSDNLDEITLNTTLGDDFDYSQRIEYSQLQTNQALVNLDMKNNKVKYLPTLYANFNYGYNTQTSQSDQWFQSDRWLNYGFVGATLSVPIFDGFLKSNKIQKNKIEAKQIQESFQELENSIDLQIRQTKINMNNALDEMAAQKENMELAKEIYDVTKIKYQEGVGSNFEVVEADTEYKEAQTNYYNALYDALVAKVELEKAYGKLLDKN
ncbi:TolC family protein [Fulvivirga sp. RKSG066]|uniref:TolC family protein n=1 Tax=Fulvivirga aurantia TaxID=2529383 RepID=UPI0012BCFAE6|nr:TolC family protein [Fulvivirga aurantia]MTI22845.1 TolC family protein [Fulvivirga aurantia]